MEKPMYILTRDVAETLTYTHKLEMVNGDRKLKATVQEIEDEYLAKFTVTLSDSFTFRVISVEEVRNRISEELSRIRETVGPTFVISMDHIYAPDADAFLDATRETHPVTLKSRLSNRFGTKPIDRQIKDIRTQFSGKLAAEKDKSGVGFTGGVVIVDVGSVTGGTITKMYERLNKRGVPVTKVVLGITSNEGKTSLEAKFGASVTVLENHEFAEWIELRDLLLISGRKVPQQYTKDGMNRIIPYTENLGGWASVPEAKEEEVKALSIALNRKLLELLRSRNLETNGISEFVKIGQKHTVKTAR